MYYNNCPITIYSLPNACRLVGDVDWIELPQLRVKWRALVNK